MDMVADRVWQTRPQLKPAVVESLGWFNNARLHESLGDILAWQAGLALLTYQSLRPAADRRRQPSPHLRRLQLLHHHTRPDGLRQESAGNYGIFQRHRRRRGGALSQVRRERHDDSRFRGR